MKLKLLLIALLAGTLSLKAQSPFSQVNLEWVLDTYPERVKMLLQSIGSGHPELEDVRNHTKEKNYREACLALIEYYKNSSGFPSLRHPQAEASDIAEARRILTDTLILNGVTGLQKRRPDGTIDWAYTGPKEDDEWAHQVNRQEWFLPLLNAYHQSGEVKFAGHLNELLLDWIISNPYPVEDECCPQWRTLNTALRFTVWPAVFYGLQKSDAFSDAARILMLISVIEQAELIRRFHWTHQNLAIFQLAGLARIAVHWPELRPSDAWFDYAARHMLYEMEGQVLPDGVQNELTSMYHHGTLRRFQELMDLGEKVGKGFPPAFRKGLEKMYNYLAYTMRPDGNSLLSNDANLSDFRNTVAKGAEQFERPDWLYIINKGEHGRQPEQTDILFPYAGQVIMRNGWDRDAHWSFFDAGPHGMAHRHDDKLHLSVSAYGRDLLVDAGRYWYKSDIWREYFVSSYSHNVILVDGFGHRPDIRRYQTPDQVAFETTPAYTYAQATFDAGFREIEDDVLHTRGVLYLRDRFWIVIDRLISLEEHTIQPLWHFHPSCRVERERDRVFTSDPGAGNLLIQPVRPADWSLELEYGPEEISQPGKYQEWKPRAWDEFPIKGAYSETYNSKKANYVAVYSGALKGELTCAWLLMPFRGLKRPEDVEAELHQEGNHLIISIKDQEKEYRLAVDIAAGKVVESSF